MVIVNTIKDLVRTLIGEIPTKKLEKRGMKVGENFTRQQGCFIDPTHCWLISIGDNVTFSIRVTVLAHDASTKLVTNYTEIGRVTIGNNVFVGANTTILPNVSIGNNVIIGSNSVITKDFPGNCVIAGNPARVIRTLDEYSIRTNEKFRKSPRFSKDYTMVGQLTEIKKKEMLERLPNGQGGFIE
jgi:maltose O-acetyltransferase